MCSMSELIKLGSHSVWVYRFELRRCIGFYIVPPQLLIQTQAGLASRAPVTLVKSTVLVQTTRALGRAI